MAHVLTIVLILATLVGCATPAAFVSATAISPHQIERFRSLDCEQLAIDVGALAAFESQMASEMTDRAVKQGLLNVLAVGAMSVGGVGFASTVRGESDRRTQLANTRSEIDALHSVMREKGCAAEKRQ